MKSSQFAANFFTIADEGAVRVPGTLFSAACTMSAPHAGCNSAPLIWGSKINGGLRGDLVDLVYQLHFLFAVILRFTGEILA
jgi:hypothetical protein